jgi:hypothetical protein
MDTEVKGRIGEARAGSGVIDTLRLGNYLDAIVSELHGRYFEQTLRNHGFRSMVKAVTVAATHNTPIAAATATPVLGLHNPVGSNKAAIISRISAGSVSGTPAGGQFVLNAIQVTTAPTTPGGNIFAGLLSAAASPQGSVMRPFNNVALTGMLPVIGNELDLVGGATAVAVAAANNPIGEDIGGSIIVPPGFVLALMAGTGAGTTWIVNAGWAWEEIDWPL